MKPTITRSEAVSIPVPSVDEKKCTHCGKCSEVCAYKNAIAVLGEHVLTFLELCHGCGAGSYLYPEKAVSEVPQKFYLRKSPGVVFRDSYVLSQNN